MRYIPKVKGLVLALRDTNNAAFKPPVKGVTVRFDRLSPSQTEFQFFKKDKPITPRLLALDVNGNQMVGITNQTPSHELAKIDIDFEKGGAISPPYILKQGKVFVGADGELFYVADSGNVVSSGLVVVETSLMKNNKFNRNYSSLMAVADGSGKIAILNTETLSVSPFAFTKGEFDVCGFVNYEQDDGKKGFMVVKTPLEPGEKTLPIDQDSWFTLIDEEGTISQNIKASGFLWSETVKQKTEAGEREYSYMAFKTGVGRDNISTTVFKINNDTGEIIQTIALPYEAALDYQPAGLIHTLGDGSLLLVTKKQFKNFEGLGASVIRPDGKLEIVLPNENRQVNIKRDGGELYIDYLKGKDFGRVALDSSKHDVSTSVRSFLKLVNKHMPTKPVHPQAASIKKSAIEQIKATTEEVQALSSTIVAKQKSEQ